MELVLYKKKYTIAQGYKIFVNAARLLKRFRSAQKSELISEQFIKRIMLAVTEVNGCEVCSYEHAKTALEMGMSEEEIQALLSGNTESIPQDEAKAIFFAQHYAESEGQPSKEAWQEIVSHYGEEKALAILSAIRIIMFGNSYGLAISAFRSRIKGEKVASSSLAYELAMLGSLIFVIPLGSIQALFENLLKKPLI